MYNTPKKRFWKYRAHSTQNARYFSAQPLVVAVLTIFFAKKVFSVLLLTAIANNLHLQIIRATLWFVRWPSVLLSYKLI